MNTGNTYYFIDDFNQICKCENGMKSDESIILETYELVDDINRVVEENEQLKQSYKEFEDECQSTFNVMNRKQNDLYRKNFKLKEENEQLKEINQELYDFRLILNALLFNEWAENKKYEVYKSKRHSDGELCFDGEWFVVVAILPNGQVTNHYHVKYWDYFKIPSYEKVKDEFDGHTSTDVLIRYGLMLK